MQINKLKLGKAIIAGDFNSNKVWDKWDRWWNHSDVVNELSELEIESIYHKYYNENQGEETISTFYLRKDLTKNYHIDYIFASKAISYNLAEVKIGENKKWLKYSDHMPFFTSFIYPISTNS